MVSDTGMPWARSTDLLMQLYSMNLFNLFLCVFILSTSITSNGNEFHSMIVYCMEMHSDLF